jgi:hypothetical protein
MYVSACNAVELLCTEVKARYRNDTTAGVMLCWFLEEYRYVSVCLLEEMLLKHRILPSTFMSILAEDCLISSNILKNRYLKTGGNI